jgi:predicted metal-dependent HD superfamily phosphohydrolase
VGVDELLSRWMATFTAPDPAAQRAAGEDLLRRWSEPHRHYHAVAHLAFMLSIVDSYAPVAPATVDLTAVRLACWFHDAIYDPRRGDNEEASAQLAESVLQSLQHPSDEVARLVRLTVTHDPEPADHNGQLLCDADLAILGAPADQYAEYAAAIRREYAHVPEAAFRHGRSAVLRGLLAKPALFHLAVHEIMWANQAKVNMDNEVSVLTDDPMTRQPFEP